MVTPQSQVRLDRGGLPSETLKSGSLERGESAGGTEEAILRVSAALAHRSNVPLQVFSGETTPILRIVSPPVTEGLLEMFFSNELGVFVFLNTGCEKYSNVGSRSAAATKAGGPAVQRQTLIVWLPGRVKRNWLKKLATL